MGADFIEKATPSFKKSWDRARVTLGTADLFTRTPDCVARTAAADIIRGAHLEVGDRLTVEAQGSQLIARRANSVVASFTNPPPDLLQAVIASCGIAKGTVEVIHTTAGVAEISLC